MELFILTGFAVTTLMIAMAVSVTMLVHLGALVRIMWKVYFESYQTWRATRIFRKHLVGRGIEAAFVALHKGRNRTEDGPFR